MLFQFQNYKTFKRAPSNDDSGCAISSADALESSLSVSGVEMVKGASPILESQSLVAMMLMDDKSVLHRAASHWITIDSGGCIRLRYV